MQSNDTAPGYTLVVGASGATGRLLVQQLLERGHKVRVIVRSADSLPGPLKQNPGLEITCASILEIDDATLDRLVAGCSAIVSCLGHNLTLKGVFGPPRRLVTNSVQRLCKAVKNVDHDMPVKFVLMNTTGNRNRDLDEPVSTGQKIAVFLLRHLLPPHADNEQAADYLRTRIGQDDRDIEWVAVRPDTLTNADKSSDYDVHPSPIRSAIFDAGQTSRINVADFMARLIEDDDTWHSWKGRMPVIYNRE